MNIIVRYREAFSLGVVASVVLTAVAIGTDGHAQDGTPPQPRPRPNSSSTPTFTSTPTRAPRPTVSSMPTVPPITLPPSSLPPSVIVAIPTPTPTRTPTPSAVPTTPTPTPSPTATPHNKAKGLKDGCLVQKKKWLLVVPCPPAHKNEVMP